MNDAFNNGLFIQKLSLINFDNAQIDPSVLRYNLGDIRDICLNIDTVVWYNNASNAERVNKSIFTLCKNIEKLVVNANNTRTGTEMRSSIYDIGLRFADDIRYCAFMRGITELCVPHMSDTGFACATRLRKLNANNNPLITTCEPFAHTLKILYASENCTITDVGLQNCIHLKILNIRNNFKITTCAPFARTIKIVNASGQFCMMGDDGLKTCERIKELHVIDNRKITTYAPFAKTLRRLDAPFATYSISISRIEKIKKYLKTDTYFTKSASSYRY